MKFLNDLLGFAVLTSPLWLILLLLPVSLWIASKVAKRLKPGITGFAGGVGIFALVFLVPFADEIAGRVYLNHLCTTQAGVKVYQTVELPAEYWDEQGAPLKRLASPPPTPSLTNTPTPSLASPARFCRSFRQ